MYCRSSGTYSAPGSSHCAMWQPRSTPVASRRHAAESGTLPLFAMRWLAILPAMLPADERQQKEENNGAFVALSPNERALGHFL